MSTALQGRPLVVIDFSNTGIPGQESYSPFVMKVERLLKWAGLPYTRYCIKGPGEIKKINPRGQLPALRIGEEVVADSTAIAHRIEALSGRSLGGAEDWLWEEFGDRVLYHYALWARWGDDDNFSRVIPRFFKAAPGFLRGIIGRQIRKGVVKRLWLADFTRGGEEATWARYRETLDLLDARAPEAGFWTGPALTVADVGLFAPLHALRTEISPGQAAELASRPRLTAWLDRVDAATRG